MLGERKARQVERAEGFDKGFATACTLVALAAFTRLAVLVALGVVAIGAVHAASEVTYIFTTRHTLF